MPGDADWRSNLHEPYSITYAGHTTFVTVGTTRSTLLLHRAADTKDFIDDARAAHTRAFGPADSVEFIARLRQRP